MLGLAILGSDGCMDATAYVEVADNGHLSRPAHLHQMVENLIDNGLVESSFIAIGPEIELEGFELDAKLVGNVGDPNRREIGLAGARTHAGKLRTFHVDLIIALRTRIGERFQPFTR